MTALTDRDAREKELLEYLRVFVMVWQKIDFIWGMFVTSYIPLFGFLHFYQGQIDGSFGMLFAVAIAAFTWINGTALVTHYDIAATMSREYRRLNKAFPDLNAALSRRGIERRGRLVYFTHTLAFAGFLYMMGERVGETLCSDRSGWGCLWAVLVG
ncbi:hypothetical protein [Pseudoponticoccus marisrubri]|uniref:Uncharacterized protein n=1 Tax=Pseudoponticoccus marisrubri TaxID=1685382 RepID=A0A0W7WL29_9RHOB|nr:hypothetical protein [Pseudoponticoccus marisrubri]KUF11220.1 hypothetical protein AVJ23_09225 [Pseudoponticoccus marisrubri]